jgi:hypothetical protein
LEGGFVEGYILKIENNYGQGKFPPDVPNGTNAIL